jgi:hypothetical protein
MGKLRMRKVIWLKEAKNKKERKKLFRGKRECLKQHL